MFTLILTNGTHMKINSVSHYEDNILYIFFITKLYPIDMDEITKIIKN